ncbi:DUF4870 domain-containing protein [Lactiplantibacillus sp. WILCCON 0030]|uniref:DUF4870 domain-containing protein n=1 Tax=Lactiplantibacillus brownii TaxID=3069269 RepID=A0ABU1AEE9_9LACO|nr:DUF4870 domain-containing protein [Lactiplantibacillus brownii]MDQ7938585.1 DUF4870 domain-containing protein [Lactiplantibacillus brownii]
MTRHRVINSLSYLSILFLPVLFPLIVWALTGDDPEIHRPAGQAFWVQLLPTIMGLIFLITLAVSGFYMDNLVHSGWLAIVLLAVLVLVALGSYLYALVRGIMYLVSE